MKGSIIFGAHILGRATKWGVIAVILAGLVTLCPGQQRSEGRLRGSARRSTLKIIQLPEVNLAGSITFEQALAKRRSVRQFSVQPLKFEQIGQLAWAGQGITDPETGWRTAPSAGETYPIDLYFAIPEGLFVYRPANHSLEQTLDQDVRGRLAAAAGMQQAVANAGCDIIVAGSVRKLTPRFRDKARQYMLLEAGHIAQNIQLQAVSLELGSVTIGGFETREVSRACKLLRTLEPLYIIPVGYPAGQAPTETGQEQASTGPEEPVRTRPKAAVLIIGRENFRDEELFETKRVLDVAGVRTTIASTRIGVIRGALGGMAEARVSVDNLRVDDYDAIIFVGGLGAREYFSSPVALNIIREAAVKRMVLAAISIAPTILANAGVLNGVRATSFISERTTLERAGAVYTGAAVERDRLIITAVGPIAAGQFGGAIAEALAGR